MANTFAVHPHPLDRLAAEGVTFDNCYTPAADLRSGTDGNADRAFPAPHRGVLTNNDMLPSDMPTYAHSLGADGYEDDLQIRSGCTRWGRFKLQRLFQSRSGLAIIRRNVAPDKNTEVK